MNAITVDPANVDHLRFLYRLLDERPALVNISHKKMPTYQEHIAFVESNPYQLWYIVRIGEENIGSFCFTKANEIGVFLLRSWQGKGYGKKVLALAESMSMQKRILANVAPNNDRSHILFQKAGYRKISETYEKIVD